MFNLSLVALHQLRLIRADLADLNHILRIDLVVCVMVFWLSCRLQSPWGFYGGIILHCHFLAGSSEVIILSLVDQSGMPLRTVFSIVHYVFCSVSIGKMFH